MMTDRRGATVTLMMAICRKYGLFFKKSTAIVFPDRPAAFERRSHEGGGRKGRLLWHHLGDCM